MENRKTETKSLSPGAISDFKDLETWKFARRLRLAVYDVTKAFPAEEKYSLTGQLRRAAVSLTANLAEGYGRFSYQENIQFCRQSRGSLYELRDHLTTALDAGYISEEKYRDLESAAMDVLRLLNGYIRSTRNRRAIGEKSEGAAH